nr:hypothetical protein Iba_chr14dCG1850 [Ipomoea batatas]GMD89626.1 hypothetical protein Iba_chr14dCG1860 [Ipomoea batatas]
MGVASINGVSSLSVAAIALEKAFSTSRRVNFGSSSSTTFPLPLATFLALNLEAHTSSARSKSSTIGTSVIPNHYKLMGLLHLFPFVQQVPHQCQSIQQIVCSDQQDLQSCPGLEPDHYQLPLERSLLSPSP